MKIESVTKSNGAKDTEIVHNLGNGQEMTMQNPDPVMLARALADASEAELAHVQRRLQAESKRKAIMAQLDALQGSGEGVAAARKAHADDPAKAVAFGERLMSKLFLKLAK